MSWQYWLTDPCGWPLSDSRYGPVHDGKTLFHRQSLNGLYNIVYAPCHWMLAGF